MFSLPSEHAVGTSAVSLGWSETPCVPCMQGCVMVDDFLLFDHKQVLLWSNDDDDDHDEKILQKYFNYKVIGFTLDLSEFPRTLIWNVHSFVQELMLSKKSINPCITV